MNNKLHSSARIWGATLKGAGRSWPAFLAFTLFLIIGQGSVMAHHPSGSAGGSAGPIVTTPADTLSAGQTVIGVTFEYIKFDQLSDTVLAAAAENDQDVHGLKTIQSTALTIAYGLLDNITIALRMPFIKRTGIIEGEVQPGQATEIADLGEPTGYGDLTLSGQFRLFNDQQSGTSLAVIGGVKLPTGDTDEFAKGEGILLDAEFQPGSGSVDWLLGVAVSQSLGKLSLHSNVLYTFVQKGTQNTDLGDRFQYNLAASVRVIGEEDHIDEPDEPAHDHGPQIDLVLELNGEWEDQQEIRGVVDPHSGGTVIYLSPGVRFAKDNWSGFVSAGFPVVNDLRGIQAEPDWRLLVGAAVSLP